MSEGVVGVGTSVGLLLALVPGAVMEHVRFEPDLLGLHAGEWFAIGVMLIVSALAVLAFGIYHMRLDRKEEQWRDEHDDGPQ